MPNSSCASMHGSWPMAICSGASSECVGSYALPGTAGLQLSLIAQNQMTHEHISMQCASMQAPCTPPLTICDCRLLPVTAGSGLAAGHPRPACLHKLSSAN
jgi:hypothetical protein